MKLRLGMPAMCMALLPLAACDESVEHPNERLYRLLSSGKACTIKPKNQNEDQECGERPIP